MERGTLNTGGTAITSPLADANLPSAQGWPDLDRRGNWPTFEQTVNGNSTEQTRLANGVNEYTLIDPDGGGQQSAVSLTYDDAGNLLQDPETFWSYEYDEENRLRYAESYDQYDSLDIWYDALGRRIFTYDFRMNGPYPGPVDHVFSGLSVIEEYEGGSQNPSREFVWGASFTEPVAMITPGGVWHYLHGALGSVTALTNAAGAVVERYFYDPYGKTYIYSSGGTLLSQSAYGNPFMWTGQRYDPSVKLYHFWARTYSPALGRWLQRDPLGYVDGVGLYEYVGGHPSLSADPFGLADAGPYGFHYEPEQKTTQPSGGDGTGGGGGGGGSSILPVLADLFIWLTGGDSDWEQQSWVDTVTAKCRDWGSSGTPFVNDARDYAGLVSGTDPVTTARRRRRRSSLRTTTTAT